MGAAGAFLMATRAIAQPRRVPRVVWLLAGPPNQEKWVKRIPEGFAKLGLVEGRDISLAFEFLADAGSEREQQIRKIVASRPDVIAGNLSLELPLFKRLTREIPIVFHDWPADPARLGLVESLRRPGANLTGTSHVDMYSRMLGLLKEIDPSMKVVGALIDKERLGELSENSWREVSGLYEFEGRAEAARSGMEMRDIVVSRNASAATIAESVRESGAQGLLVSATFPMTPELVKFMQRSPIPCVGTYFFNVRKGLLVGLSYESDEGPAQAIAMVARILRGEKPATIPIYQHMRYALGVNLRTAASAGIRIPDSILVQADLIVR